MSNKEKFISLLENKTGLKYNDEFLIELGTFCPWVQDTMLASDLQIEGYKLSVRDKEAPLRKDRWNYVIMKEINIPHLLFCYDFLADIETFYCNKFPLYQYLYPSLNKPNVDLY